MKSSTTRVAGVGMTPFAKPGKNEPYEIMAEKATRAALADAGIDFSLVQQAYVGYVYGDSTCGQAALYRVGMGAIPIVNVNNNCATGSTTLWLARQAIESGAAECVLALGFEEMKPGALGSVFTDRTDPMYRHAQTRDSVVGAPQANVPAAATFFGAAGQNFVDEGVDPTVFARISVKARKHAVNNPSAVFRATVTLDEVLESPAIYGPLTRLQCCPPTCGAAAAVLCTPEFAARHGLDAQVALRAQAMVTDTEKTFTSGDMRSLVGYDMAADASRAVYEAAGIDPADIDVVELHDCFTTNEFLAYEALGLTARGTAERFVIDDQNTYGGQVVVNPSGGLLSKGHPLGATGLAQCAELVWQLRGQAGPRQVDGARLALQHNVGLGGACVVGLYEKVAG